MFNTTIVTDSIEASDRSTLDVESLRADPSEKPSVLFYRLPLGHAEADALGIATYITGADK